MKIPIANIFSNKQEKPPNKTQIIIDTREKQSLVASCLIEQNANIKFEKLEIADYLINETAIERKTFSDFISSMLNKRLFTQLTEIKKYPRYFLIIEGRETKYPLDKPTKGMILSIITQYEIPIIFTANEQETSDYLLLLAKKQDKPKTQLSLRPSKSQLTPQEQKQFILEGFPGIGPTTAKQLLEKHQTLKKIFSLSEEELKQINKFDINKIRKFLELLES